MIALSRELQAGAPRLRGTTLNGTVHVREADLNAWLAANSNAGLVVEIQSDNRLVVHYGVVHATMTLPRNSSLSASPELTMSLSSIAIAWALKRVLKHPFVRIEGRHVIVDLAAIPALRPYRELLRSVTHVGLITSHGALTVQWNVSIT